MFGLIDRISRAAVDVVTLPVSVVADAATMGGVLNDRDEPYTVTKAKRIGKDAVDLVKTLAE